MTSDTPQESPVPGRGGAEHAARAADGLQEAAFVLGSLAVVALVALLDLRTGPDLSFGIFYVLIAAGCARRGGFAHGSLAAVAGAAAWHAVDALENPSAAPSIALWNGVVRFGTL